MVETDKCTDSMGQTSLPKDRSRTFVFSASTKLSLPGPLTGPDSQTSQASWPTAYLGDILYLSRQSGPAGDINQAGSCFPWWNLGRTVSTTPLAGQHEKMQTLLRTKSGLWQRSQPCPLSRLAVYGNRGQGRKHGENSRGRGSCIFFRRCLYVAN